MANKQGGMEKGTTIYGFYPGTVHAGLTVLSGPHWNKKDNSEGIMREAHYIVRYACGCEGKLGHKSLADRVLHRRDNGEGICRQCTIANRGTKVRVSRALKPGDTAGDVVIVDGPYWRTASHEGELRFARYFVRFTTCGHEGSLTHKATVLRKHQNRDARFLGLCPSCTASKREAIKQGGEGETKPVKETVLPNELEYRRLELAHLVWNGKACPEKLLVDSH